MVCFALLSSAGVAQAEKDIAEFWARIGFICFGVISYNLCIEGSYTPAMLG